MAVRTEASLDATDLRILVELQADARITMAELGRRVALSAPAVTERVRRLEAAGVIEGYEARVAPRSLGYGLLAFIRLSFPTVASTSPNLRRFLEEIGEVPEVLECHNITGEDCYLLKIVARDPGHLEELIGRLADFGRTTTSIVLSSPVAPRSVVSVDEAAHPDGEG